MRKAVLLCLPLAILVLAVCASADNLPPVAPHNLTFFDSMGPGSIDPCWFVGFNPQPDPPGDNAQPDMRNPFAPRFTQPGSGLFSIWLGMNTDAGDQPTFSNIPGNPVFGDGSVRFAFDATLAGQMFQIVYNIGGFNGSWVGFNPQPDPPGFGGDTIGFAFQGDPWLTLQVFALDPNGNNLGALQFIDTSVPEPSSLALFGTGLIGVAGVIRRKLRL